jgi:hypothetical protein
MAADGGVHDYWIIVDGMDDVQTMRGIRFDPPANGDSPLETKWVLVDQIR